MPKIESMSTTQLLDYQGDLNALREKYKIRGISLGLDRMIFDRVEKTLLEAIKQEVIMPEDMERIKAVQEVMGENMTNIEKWKTKYAQLLFKVSKGRIRVISIPEVPESLTLEMVNGTHSVDDEKSYKEAMGIAVIPEIEVEGRPLKASDLPKIFSILNGRSMMDLDFRRNEELEETSIPSGWYEFSHEAVPGTSDLHFDHMQEILIKKYPEFDVADDDPRANEISFLFAIEDYITRIGLEEYRKNGYLGEGESTEDWKYVRLRNMGSCRDRLVVGCVTSNGPFVYLVRPCIADSSAGRLFFRRLS